MTRTPGINNKILRRMKYTSDQQGILNRSCLISDVEERVLNRANQDKGHNTEMEVFAVQL